MSAFARGLSALTRFHISDSILDDKAFFLNLLFLEIKSLQASRKFAVWILTVIFCCFCSFGLLFRRRFFGLECFQLFSCLFFAVFRLCSFLGGVGSIVVGVKTGNSQANMRG